MRFEVSVKYAEFGDFYVGKIIPCLRRRATRDPFPAPVVAGLGLFCPRETESEGRAGTQRARHGEIPVHRPRELAADGETEPRALVRNAQRASTLYERP